MSSEVKRAHHGIAKKIVFNSYGGTASITRQAVSSAPKDRLRGGFRRSVPRDVHSGAVSSVGFMLNRKTFPSVDSHRGDGSDSFHIVPSSAIRCLRG